MADSSRPLFVHVHIPKCAGTSFNALLRESFGSAHADVYSPQPDSAYETAYLDELVTTRPNLISIASHSIRRYPRTLGGRRALYACFLRDPLGSLEFDRVDPLRFPCVRLASEAIRRGGTAPAALNAANEVAVEAFLAGRLPFTGIPEIIERVLHETPAEPLESLDQVYAVDIEARGLAARFIARATAPAT